TPDPIVAGTEETFVIKGKMKKDIVTGDFLGIAFIDAEQPTGFPFIIVDICSLSGVTCPIKAGTAFSTFSTTQKLTAPKELPTSYIIDIRIGHEQRPNIEPIACAIAFQKQLFSM
ncbi:hypothetical protein RhiirA4_473403, partial [Rhizophagus irregularis]